MPCLLLSILLFVQGIPIQSAQGGILSGVLRDNAGNAFSLNSIDGTFEFRHLLPGSYTL